MNLLKFGLTLFALFQIQIPFHSFFSINQEKYYIKNYQQDFIKEDVLQDKTKDNDYILKNIKKEFKSNEENIDINIIKEKEDEMDKCNSLVVIDSDELTSVVTKEIKKKKTLPQNLVILENKKLYSNIVNEIVYLTNQERIAMGLKELQYDDELTNIAMERAIEGACNNCFSHTRPNGEDFVSLYEYYNVSFSICGENLGRYQTSASEVFEDWMNSPTHKENILYDFDYIGIGVAIDSDKNYYFVQEFKKE